MDTPNPPVRSVKFNNLARDAGSNFFYPGRRQYDWIVYVDEDEGILQQIAAVEYLLHRTFSNPLRRKTDPTDHFAVRSTGWGGFTILITVFLKSGVRFETSYDLDLGKSWDENFPVERTS